MFENGAVIDHAYAKNHCVLFNPSNKLTRFYAIGWIESRDSKNVRAGSKWGIFSIWALVDGIDAAAKKRRTRLARRGDKKHRWGGIAMEWEDWRNLWVGRNESQLLMRYLRGQRRRESREMGESPTKRSDKRVREREEWKASKKLMSSITGRKSATETWFWGGDKVWLVESNQTTPATEW